ncbi:MAG: adenine deaminase [Phycisphaeraceae bacterium]
MQDASFEINGNIVDVIRGRVCRGRVVVTGRRIKSVTYMEDVGTEADGPFLMPGFIDAHIHIESSMLTPCQFARQAVIHGTVATVSDPHEIANVLGIDGVRFMLDDAAKTPLKILFGAPSCVPATPFETSGAVLDAEAVTRLLNDPRIGYLSEVMNYPGVLKGDREVLAKIRAAQACGKPVDGHAPGLRGSRAAEYIRAGISTDHECFTKDEALDKLAAGAVIQIREGSAARNFDALYTLIDEFPHRVMLCSDDKHPDELMAGHINNLARRAVEAGCDPLNVIRAACANPAHHYRLEVGLLQEGDPADFIVVDNLHEFSVLKTYINGVCVAEAGQTQLDIVTPETTPNQFAAEPVRVPDLRLACTGDQARVIGAMDGQLVTECRVLPVLQRDGQVQPDVTRDILKIVVVNRYRAAAPAVALVQGFGLKRGAIASSVAHDSHNIVAVGTSDDDLKRAINSVIRHGGGLSYADENTIQVLPLPIAGLISTDTCQAVAEIYAKLDRAARQAGATLRAPYMTLSFMALLVIPSLKLSDKGLFDGEGFKFVSVGVTE